ncbi:MAG: SDR family oxidoreductase [Dehalococcoidia bacterium]
MGTIEMNLKDKVVVVTGAGNGMGKACAERFAAEGARVVAADIEEEAANSVARQIGGVGIGVDITAERNVVAVVDLARRTYGDIDLWFSNAGHPGPLGFTASNEEWNRLWQLHVMAHVYAARALLPTMLARGSGYLLQTVSSVALSANPVWGAYSVTKHASLALGEWLAINYRRHGVAVSCFCPSGMNTRLLRGAIPVLGEGVLAAALEPEEVAEIVLRGIEREDFLIVTRPEVLGEAKFRGADREAWIKSYPDQDLDALVAKARAADSTL